MELSHADPWLQLHAVGRRFRHPVTGEALRLRSWCPLAPADPLN